MVSWSGDRKPADRVPGTVDAFYLVLAERRRRDRLRERNRRLALRRERRERWLAWWRDLWH